MSPAPTRTRDGHRPECGDCDEAATTPSGSSAGTRCSSREAREHVDRIGIRNHDRQAARHVEPTPGLRTGLPQRHDDRPTVPTAAKMPATALIQSGRWTGSTDANRTSERVRDPHEGRRLLRALRDHLPLVRAASCAISRATCSSVCASASRANVRMTCPASRNSARSVRRVRDRGCVGPLVPVLALVHDSVLACAVAVRKIIAVVVPDGAPDRGRRLSVVAGQAPPRLRAHPTVRSLRPRTSAFA
jgi:hypothetical protein